MESESSARFADTPERISSTVSSPGSRIGRVCLRMICAWMDGAEGGRGVNAVDGCVCRTTTIHHHEGANPRPRMCVYVYAPVAPRWR